ncbi:Trk system potassium transporter TrkA [Aerococcus sp. UMB7834]|uniref:Trk system potassium transporter TrkA n=1 Tax=Aerococcus sp. UMB7834 TaxID=3046342 RepID=UPI0025507FA6|nr:Trk system potassium transporter TrkA [Aerococcus sp. UMB7834]MDK6805365.1 Trk system potassium transporter TrkA [Aerococcus sp. UMB7834]
MKISIVGAGAVGSALCEDLSSKQYDVTLIEKDAHKLEDLLANYDIMGVLGNAATISVLEEANIKDCDVFIAVTNYDEINLMASIVAKELGAKYTIARVSNPEYTDYLNFSNGKLGIDLIVNPELEAATEMLNNLDYPSAFSVESFFRGRAHLISLDVSEGSQIDGLALSQLGAVFDHIDKILICVVERQGEIFIPYGDFVIRANDRVYVTGDTQQLREFYKVLGGSTKKIRSTMIVGASNIAFHLVPKLIQRKIAVKVIERKEEKALRLAAENEEAVVIVGDGTHPDLLFEEYLENFDALITLTGIDEENIVLSILAKRLGIGKTLTKMDRVALIEYTGLMDLETVVIPHQLFADRIIHLVRSFVRSYGSNIEKFYRIANNQVEAIEFTVASDSRLVGKSLIEINLVDNVMIGSIFRQGQIIIPSGHDQLQAGDRLIIVAYQRDISDLDDILRG